MYTDDDLTLAVKKGIFLDSSVNEFRELISSLKEPYTGDNDNLRLVGGLNDVFTLIACALVLFSSRWAVDAITSGWSVNIITDNDRLGMFTFTGLAWLLAEFFVRKRNMALSAIFLLLGFVAGVFFLSLSFFEPSQQIGLTSELSFITAAAISAIAACIHWFRFKVPITVAVGTVAIVGFCILLTLKYFPDANDWLLAICLISGCLSFAFAMYWDSSDTNRVTRKSDVAFWLHLLSAPLIIHPIFSGLGMLEGRENLMNIVAVIVLYLFMTLISIVIDRRAFMISSLVYVLYALSSLLREYGDIGYSSALTGLFIGGALLLLSAYWHIARSQLVSKLPMLIQDHVPTIKITNKDNN